MRNITLKYFIEVAVTFIRHVGTLIKLVYRNDSECCREEKVENGPLCPYEARELIYSQIMCITTQSVIIGMLKVA